MISKYTPVNQLPLALIPSGSVRHQLEVGTRYVSDCFACAVEDFADTQQVGKQMPFRIFSCLVDALQGSPDLLNNTDGAQGCFSQCSLCGENILLQGFCFSPPQVRFSILVLQSKKRFLQLTYLAEQSLPPEVQLRLLSFTLYFKAHDLFQQSQPH